MNDVDQIYGYRRGQSERPTHLQITLVSLRLQYVRRGYVTSTPAEQALLDEINRRAVDGT